MPILAVGFLFSFVFQCFTLVVTGRVFTRFSSVSTATLQEDVIAAITVLLLTSIVFGASFLFPPLMLAVPILYLVLIYYAFQLDGFMDAVFFFFLHAVIAGSLRFMLHLLEENLLV